MHFINKVNFKATSRWSILNVIENFTGVVNFSARGGIYFEQINKTPGIHIFTNITFTARVSRNTFLAI